MDQTEKKRILDFVHHLLSLRNIRLEPPVIGEGLIRTFLMKNIRTIKETLRSRDFFPDVPPEVSLQNIQLILKQYVLNQVMPRVKVWLDGKIDFVLLGDAYGKELDVAGCREHLYKFVHRMLQADEARYNFNSVINIFEHDVLDRYIGEIFRRRDSIFNEITRVERLRMDGDTFTEYTKIIFLIKDVVFVERNGTILDVKNALALPEKQVLRPIIDMVNNNIPFVPEDAVLRAIKSNYRASVLSNQDASARLYFILSSRYQDYRHQDKIDRGAEAPDKSWLSVARQNAAYYGFDQRMVNGLYLVAGDNMW
jgi:hypothetical protein